MIELNGMNSLVAQKIIKKRNKLETFNRLAGLVLLLVLVAILISDYQKLKQVLLQADFGYLSLALAMTVVSISLAALAFSVSARMFKIDAPLRLLFVCGWLGVAINNIILSAGVVGFGVRVRILKEKGFNMKQVLSASFFHSYIFQFLLAAIFPFCLLYLYLHGVSVFSQMKHVLLVIVAILFLLVMAAGALFFLSKPRRVFLVFSAEMIKRIFKRDWRDKFIQFDELLKNSLIMSNFFRIIALFVFVAGDWVFCVLTLHFIFSAVGMSVPIWYIFSGLAISLAVGFASVLPGGLGTQDLSLTGILMLGGYDLQAAVVAAILFRLIYYIVPYGLASLYYNFKFNSASD